MIGVYFHQYLDVELSDPRLYGTTRTLYDYLLQRSNISTHQTPNIPILEMALYLRRNPATVRKHLKKLIALRYIKRIFCKNEFNPAWNMPSYFIVYSSPLQDEENPDGHEANGKIYVPPIKKSTVPTSEKFTVPTAEKSEGNNRESSIEDRDLGNTLTREAETSPAEVLTPNGGDTMSPQEGSIETDSLPTIPNVGTEPQASTKPENPNPSLSRRELGENLNPNELRTETESLETPEPSTTEDYDLTGVPDIMKPTARYWLMRTGKTALKANEVEALHELANTHKPTRIQKEIDTAVARWLRQGKLPTRQNFMYIAASLSKQRSHPAQKKRTRRDEKASQNAPQRESVLVMPVEDAERVIAEYKPASRPTEALPAALSELFDGIKARDIELTEERFAALPKDADGLEVLPDDEAELEALHRGIDLPDYLRLKFPKATDAELNTDKLSASDVTALTTAMEIDKACAYCDNPEECKLPAGSQPGHGRPVAVLSNGRVSAGRNPCLTCKHSCASSQPDPDFERRVKECGLTEVHAKRDFASYSHESPEVVVAKARAILAVQNGTNLVLAGNAGAGKTHLATAIALEVIRSGRRAIVANVPEMLDGICRAAQNHEDVYGLIAKYRSVDCLVLDDWGKERSSQVLLSYMYKIINYRYERGLQTIATTNALEPDGLKNKFNADKIDPLVSRILSNGEWVTIQDAADYRLKPKVAEPPAESVPESDEKASESEVVSSAGTSTPEADSVAGKGEIEPEAEQSANDDTAPVAEPSPQSDEETATSEVVDIEERIEHPYDEATGGYVPLSYSEVKNRMSLYDYTALMKKRGEEYEKAKATHEAPALAEEAEEAKPGYTTIHVPHYDDGLDDDEGTDADLRLYGGMYSD